MFFLRYFSVYGPGQRPDMAYSKFIKAILQDEEIIIFGDGNQTRTNTFIDDCVNGTVQALIKAVNGEIYNLSGNFNLSINESIKILERHLDKKAIINYKPEQPGDQNHTSGNFEKARMHFGYFPKIDPDSGLEKQANWMSSHLKAITDFK